jgi:transposase
MEAAIMSIYHEKRKINPSEARELIKNILEQNNYNVSLTAKILGISRHTVRRARDGDLNDYSRAPKKPKTKYNNKFRNLILDEAKNTKFGARRLRSFLREKYSIFVPESTIRYILEKNKIQRKKIRTYNKNRRHLYNYDALLPFTELQIDTKHILDQTSLPKDVYKHISEKNLPLYAYNAIDAKTRIRFRMYSHNLNSTYGHLFIFLIVLWLRLHNVRDKIRIRVDNGMEFFSGSSKKLSEFNKFLSKFEAEVYTIPPGAKYLQGLIENAHKLDDEFFYSSHPLSCNNYKQFLHKSQQWLNVWNIAKKHHGIGMNGCTPLEKLQSLKTVINPKIVNFPVLRLEDVMLTIGTLFDIVNNQYVKSIMNKSGKYVIDKYQKRKKSHKTFF